MQVKNRRFYQSQIVYLNISQSLSPFLDLYLFGAVCCWMSIIYFIFKVFDLNDSRKEKKHTRFSDLFIYNLESIS